MTCKTRESKLRQIKKAKESLFYGHHHHQTGVRIVSSTFCIALLHPQHLYQSANPMFQVLCFTRNPVLCLNPNESLSSPQFSPFIGPQTSDSQ